MGSSALLVTMQVELDGIVSFRSACGVASADPRNGPGRDASLTDQIAYCVKAPKKTDHYPWLLASQNHSHIAQGGAGCVDLDCQLLVFDSEAGTFRHSPAHRKWGAMASVAKMLRDPKRTFGLRRSDLIFDPQNGTIH